MPPWRSTQAFGLLLVIASQAVLPKSGFAAMPENLRIPQALETIHRSLRGSELVSRAMALWKFDSIDRLASKFKWSDSSRTDTVLTRHFNPATGTEERERETTIYLKQDQTQEELILDLAHELVHATSRPAVDPYDPGLTPGSYIWKAIEGEGGEVEAVFLECEIGYEISAFMKLPLQRCEGYLKGPSLKAGPLEKNRIKQDFYRVGIWKTELTQKLGDETRLFPLLSSLGPTLFSSTGHAPYPSSLYTEFQEMTEIACQNSLKRLKLVGSPGSFSETTQQFLTKRCHLRQGM